MIKETEISFIKAKAAANLLLNNKQSLKYMKEAVAKIEKIDEDLAWSISDIKKFIPNYMNEIDNSYLNMLIDKFKSLKVHINDIISWCRNTLFSTFFVYLYSEIQNVLSDCILNKKFTIQHIKSLKIIEQNGDLDSTKNQNRSEVIITIILFFYFK